MQYVIYNVETTTILHDIKTGKEQYATIGAAKAALTRASTFMDDPVNFKRRYAIAERDHFHKNIEKQITRCNLISGKEYQEPINTPSYCSPAFESYWSM